MFNSVKFPVDLGMKQDRMGDSQLPHNEHNFSPFSLTSSVLNHALCGLLYVLTPVVVVILKLYEFIGNMGTCWYSFTDLQIASSCWCMEQLCEACRVLMPTPVSLSLSLPPSLALSIYAGDLHLNIECKHVQLIGQCLEWQTSNCQVIFITFYPFLHVDGYDVYHIKTIQINQSINQPVSSTYE